MASQDIFKNFIGKQVKVRYRDGNSVTSTARGILLEENENFIFLKGDITQICIQKNLIDKISSQKNGN